MDLIKKLDECEKRFKEVSELVMDPNLVKDPKKYKDTMREHGYLTELCALYDEYKKVLQGITDAKEMITAEDDPEMIVAREKDIPIIGRGEFVGFLTKKYKEALYDIKKQRTTKTNF